jgi:heme A synthase
VPTAGLVGLATVLLAAVVLLATLVVVPLRADVRRFQDRQRLAAAVTRAARQLAVIFTSASYADLPAFTGGVVAHSAPGFRRQAGAYARAYAATVAASRSVDRSRVLVTAIISASPQVASVLVVDDVEVATRAHPQGVDHPGRLELSLGYRRGRWLVSDIESVP